MLNRLSVGPIDRMREMVLLVQAKETELNTMVPSGWGASNEKTSPPVLPEAEKLRGKNVLCIALKKRAASVPIPGHDFAESVLMPGGHHFCCGKYEQLSG
jgi:type IV secretory pathway VirJ component